jgi:hypothetical protein
MRTLNSLRALIVAAATTLVCACSSGGSSAIAPMPGSPQAGTPSLALRGLRYRNPFGPLDIGARSRFGLASFNACPSRGSTEYVSDEFKSIVYIYSGKFAGQAPCGQIASAALVNPRGLHVDTVTHNLYVANWGGFNILVFHQGQTEPFNAYVDPGVQAPNDVTMSKDGIIIASNEEASDLKQRGSISTWKHGLSGGTFIGNFPMTNDDFGLYITRQSNGVIFFTDIDATSGLGAVWKVSCPAGACGVQTQLAGISILNPGAMVFDDSGRLLVNDWAESAVERFNLPNHHPTMHPMPCCPYGMAIDDLHEHWFYTSIGYAAEYSYPTFTLIGTVKRINGAMFGIAVDP